MSFKKGQYIPDAVIRILFVLTLFNDFRFTGLACFTMGAKMPDMNEISEMIHYAKKAYGFRKAKSGKAGFYARHFIESAEEIADIIDTYGGADAFREAFAGLRELESKDASQCDIDRFGLLFDVSSIGTFELPNISAVSEKYGTSSTNINRLIHELLLQAARDINFNACVDCLAS